MIRLVAVFALLSFALGLGGCRSADLVSFEVGAFSPTSQGAIVAPHTPIELLWNDGEFTEGPALAPDGTILFSDIGNTIYRFDPRANLLQIYRYDSGKANGLMFNRAGQLIACEGAWGGNRRISITDAAGQVRTLAERWDGKRFNAPNDLALDAGGRVYFTDPRYVGDEPREIDFEGVFLVETHGRVSVATRNVSKPNGILVSHDQKHVYVADHDNADGGVKQLLRFDIQLNGTLANKRVMFDFGADQRGIDGMTLDREGNIYATAGKGNLSGIYVFSPTGEHLAFIPTPGAPTNCVFGGGVEANTLYVTCAGPREKGKPQRYALCRVKLKKGR